MGYLAVFGELIVGVVLGPPLLGLLHGSEALYVLAELGVLLMMLYIGMEIDPRELTRASWAELLAAVGGFEPARYDRLASTGDQGKSNRL